MSCVQTCTAVLKKIEEGAINGDDVAGSVFAISQVSEEVMGGTSGALYSCVPSIISMTYIDPLVAYFSLDFPRVCRLLQAIL